MAQPEGTVSKAQYARLKGVSRTAVGKWVATGKVVTTPDKAWIRVEESDARLLATTDQRRGGKGGRYSAAAAAEAGGERVAAVEGVPGGGSTGRAPVPRQREGPTLADANTERALMQTRALELRFRKESGELVERSGYERALVDALGPLMEQLGSISARIGSRCAAESDPRKVTAMIDDEVAKVRQAIAGRIRSLIDSGGETEQ